MVYVDRMDKNSTHNINNFTNKVTLEDTKNIG